MKTIKDFELKNKKVIIRVDFNVPIENGIIKDDTRIKESLETINYAIKEGAKIILLSHLGRIKEEQDLEKNNLYPVALRLSELLNKKILFSNKTRGKILEDRINKLKSGEILLIQNTRYEDLEGKKESKNDSSLGKYWASLGDIFINDAFGTCHREHASNVGISKNIPSGIGFLIQKEIKEFDKILSNPDRPITVILGGAKVKDKIGVIKNLVNFVDYILIGGGMSYTFLKASGINIGKSLLDEESLEFCKEMLEKHKDKIILPVDSVNSIDINSTSRTSSINEIKDDEMGLDIGENTVKLFKTYLENSKTIFWNGPLGLFEKEQYSIGTKKICEILKEIDATKIIGGGDTVSAIVNLGFKENMTHLSTGGGASLELLEGKKLPGLEAIEG